MVTRVFNLRNENWYSPEGVMETLDWFMRDMHKDQKEYDAGPPIRVTITIESGEDLI